MTYVITQNCCNDASCVAACPIGCIHPAPDEPGYGTAEMLYIDPDSCIDCGACADACPVDAIRPDALLSAAEQPYLEINADFYRHHQPAPAFRHAPVPVPLITSREPLRVAIVGSGPAGLYTAKELLRHPGVHIDMFERLPSTGGLIHHGVAPDHLATRKLADLFGFVGDKSRVTLHVGVEIGTDVRHDELLAHHQAVVYAHGAFNPQRLDIPGYGLPGSLSAAEVVGWYNGHPDHRAVDPPLTGRRAVIVGNGNVALDIARILLTDPDDIPGISQTVRDALRGNNIGEVVLLGRRGLQHAAFTTPELLAIAQRADIDVVIDAPGPDTGHAASDPNTERKLALLLDIAAREPKPSATKRIILRFDTTATHILGQHRTTGIRLHTGEQLDTDLVIHAIGFRGNPIPGVPFDSDAGILPNVAGRVTDPATGTALPGVYTTGWIKRGPSGVIGTNRSCAHETISAILADHAAGLLARNVTGRLVRS